MVTTNRNSASEEILTEIGVADMFQVEPRTIRLWRRTRGLPFFKITEKVIRFKKTDCVAWLERHRRAVAA